MSNFCRLCAEVKAPRQLKATINDEVLKIKEKLIDCCRWHSLTENKDDRLPQNVCTLCANKLEECWIFAQAVAQAQAKLKSIFPLETPVLTKKEIKIDHDDIGNDSDYNDIFVEPLPSPEIIYTSDVHEPIVLLDENKKDDLPSNPKTDKTIQKTTTKRKRRKRPLNRKHECDVCRKKFGDRKGLKIHERVHTGERPYPCTECDMRFAISGTRKRHMLRRHGIGTSSIPKENEPVTCNVCDQQFDNKYKLRLHVVTHEGKHKCKECGKIFPVKSKLRRHMKKHSQEKPFCCYLCGNTYKLLITLKIHMRTHTDDTSYQCDTCGRKYRSKHQLSAHIKKNHGVREYTCEHCGAGFTQRCILAIHMTIHTNVRPFKCDLCDKTFKRKVLKNLHRKIHFDPITEYKCTECNKEFRNKISLKRHMEDHSGSVVKPFCCEYCDKAFRIRSNLVQHIRVHTGERPYHCENCGTNFRTMSSYYCHLRRVHGIAVRTRSTETTKMTNNETWQPLPVHDKVQY